MAYSQTDLDRLQAAIAKGARKVRMGSEEVEFRSLAEMERTEQKIKRDLGHVKSGRIAQINTSSGWR
ncbi:phage head-tail joining protein [Shimia sp.]|uniref:phage head-tail joining protein n=1 Tax=Shimia sp. TaxID=1954381 RepID=UPI003B8DFF7E